MITHELFLGIEVETEPCIEMLRCDTVFPGFLSVSPMLLSKIIRGGMLRVQNSTGEELKSQITLSNNICYPDSVGFCRY